MKKYFSVLIVLGVMLCCITPILASDYQEWDSYKTSPKTVSEYPYQFILIDEYSPVLYISNQEIYVTPNASGYQIKFNGSKNGFYRYNNSNWGVVALYSNPTTINGSVATKEESNYDVYTSSNKDLLYFAKTTGVFKTTYEAMSYLDYLLVIPDVTKEFDSWNVKISVKEVTPMGEYWRYLDQYILTQKYAWRFDRSSLAWQGRSKMYKFDITYIKDNKEVSTSTIEPMWNPIEEVRSLMPKFTIKNNDWKIQLSSTYESKYRIVLNKVLIPSTIANTSVIPVNLVDDEYSLSNTFVTIYNMPETEVGFYYELYIMNTDRTKLYSTFNWTRKDLRDWKKYEFNIDTPLMYDVVSSVSNQYGSEDYVKITPDVALDNNGNFVVSADPLDSAIDGLTSIKGSILGANNLMLSVVDMLVGYPLIATGVMMMSGVMVILVAVVVVKIFK